MVDPVAHLAQKAVVPLWKLLLLTAEFEFRFLLFVLMEWMLLDYALGGRSHDDTDV